MFSIFSDFFDFFHLLDLNILLEVSIDISTSSKYLISYKGFWSQSISRFFSHDNFLKT